MTSNGLRMPTTILANPRRGGSPGPPGRDAHGAQVAALQVEVAQGAGPPEAVGQDAGHLLAQQRVPHGEGRQGGRRRQRVGQGLRGGRQGWVECRA